MKRLLLGAVSAVTAFIATKKIKQKQDEPEGVVVWIDAGDDEEDGPLFSVGESVVTISPYTDDFVDCDFDGTPLYFDIADVKWDADDECFRYYLEDNEEWVGEDWLARPEFPFMFKSEVKTTKKEEAPTMVRSRKEREKAELARRREWSRRADELLDQYNRFVKLNDTEAAEGIMKQYRQEKAMFDAGTAIIEIGGDLATKEAKG